MKNSFYGVLIVFFLLHSSCFDKTSDYRMMIIGEWKLTESFFGNNHTDHNKGLELVFTKKNEAVNTGNLIIRANGDEYTNNTYQVSDGYGGVELLINYNQLAADSLTTALGTYSNTTYDMLRLSNKEMLLRFNNIVLGVEQQISYIFEKQ